MRAFIVIDLGYGDSGKGTTVDYLCWKYGIKQVVRFNGGPQAAHNVVTPGGRHHTCSTWGSGTLSGARTHLGEHVLFNPFNAYNEAQHLQELGVKQPYELLTVDARCPVITPWHISRNQILETERGDNRHGSCGQGIGVTMEDVTSDFPHLTAGELRTNGLAKRLCEIADHQADAIVDQLGSGAIRSFPLLGSQGLAYSMERACAGLQVVPKFLDRPPYDVVYEGAQGALIDETHGVAPYHTWSNCTFDNAMGMLRGDEEVIRLGVIRTYLTRHGAGPFATEWPSFRYHEPHNGTNEWQGPFRQGHMDFGLIRHAIEFVGGVDGIALTHLDRSGDILTFERELNVPVMISSWGPTRKEKAWR